MFIPYVFIITNNIQFWWKLMSSSKFLNRIQDDLLLNRIQDDLLIVIRLSSMKTSSRYNS